MNRRDVVLALLALGTVPPSTQAQQAPKLARIGFLGSLAAPKIAAYADHFRTGLRDFGYVEGRNVQIDFRYADGDNDLLLGLAAELYIAT
jgi:putative ABC transport system substrate-binding protein